MNDFAERLEKLTGAKWTDVDDPKFDEEDRGMTDKRTLHICDELSKINEMMAEGEFDHSYHYGMAITHIEYSARDNNILREPGRYGWVAHNGEYGTFINYCPFCGVKLEDTQ